MSEPIFRPMTPSDTSTALSIINDHDEDDFEWAKITYQQSLAGQYILELDSRVVGVTGATPIEGTDRAYGISWTYLERSFIGRGHGRTMLERLIDQIRAEGARKAFVNTSDYYDPEDGDIYRDAREAYRAVGFVEEMRHADYYDRKENQVTYGMRLEPRGPDVKREPILKNIRLTDVDEIPECDGAYWLAWELDDEGTAPSSFKMISDQVAEWGGRVIFMAFPSDVEQAAGFMTSCRFRPDGSLFDYYDDGIDELHYRFDIL